MMGKMIKKIFAFVMAFMITLSGMTADVFGQSQENPKKADPFEMMVDTMPELMTVGEIIQSASMKNINHRVIDEADIVLQPADYETIGNVHRIVEEAIENFNENGFGIEVEPSRLDYMLEQQRALVEQSKTDRFLVKYKDGRDDLFKEKVGKEIQSTIDVKNVIPEDFKTIRTDFITKDKTELIVLKNKVNPNKFTEMLIDKDVRDYIEYIQPDFKMELNVAESSQGEPAPEEDPAGTDTAKEFTGEPADNGATTKEAIAGKLPGIQNEKTLIALIDTGLDITHPDLEAHIYVNRNEIPDNGVDDDGNGYIDDVSGWNFPDHSGIVYDENLGLEQAHATHIAGIIAGLSNADDGFIPNDSIEILPLKVFSNGTAYTSDIIAAIGYAREMGAVIVNCSFGSTYDNPALKEAMENAGMLFVCSAGNARTDLKTVPVFPACFDLDNIISVTSSNADGGLSYFSNYSPDFVDLAALGRDISSTLPNGEYGPQSGTSMSTALTSGIAAAVLNEDDTLDSAELKQRLLDTSDKLSNLQDTVTEGRRINASDAISNVVKTGIIYNSPESDFDVKGYNPTLQELYQLYSSGTVVKVAAGDQISLILKNDGTVWAWGDNTYGQCGNGSALHSVSLTRVIGLSNVTNIATGGSHSLAVKSDGTVWAWGNNSDGQLGDGTVTRRTTPVQVSGLTGAVSVAAGVNFSLATRSDGTVRAWGNNTYGQLGDGTTTGRTTPVQVSGLTGAASIAAGGFHSLAAKTDGTARAWGLNSYGELGDGTTANKTTPVQMSGLTGVISVSGGYSHSLAVKSNGQVWACGRNAYGQLGDGSTTQRSTPVQVSGLTGASKVAAGDYHSTAMKSDGTVWSWGWNGSGALGDGTTVNRSTPVRTSGLTGATSIAAGLQYGLALKSDGSVWAWGMNEHAQLGDGNPVIRIIPKKINTLTGMASIVAASDEYSLAVKTGGNLWVWGDNSEGQLGNGTTISSSTPIQISGVTGVSSLAGNYDHSLAVKSNGTVWAWGYNGDGQLGDGTTTDRISPVQVSGLTGVSKVAAGEGHSLAVKTNGTAWAWGYNNRGQLGDGSTTDRTTPVQVSGLTGVSSVAAGQAHSLALKSDGTVWTWGRNNYGQLGNGTTTDRTTPVQVSGLTGVVSIAAGHYHNLAVKSDGTVWAWGRNNYGQLGDGTTANRTTPVQVSGMTGAAQAAAGELHSLVRKSNGTVWAWGRNDDGQLGNGTVTNRTTPVQTSGLTGVASIEGGSDHSLAVTTDGAVWAWGMDTYGQLGQSRLLGSYIPVQSQAYIGVLSFGANPYTAVIPASGINTITVSASGTDPYGNPIPPSGIIYSLATAYPGVSVNSSTGVVTISASAQTGSVQVNATYQSLICSASIELTAPPDIIIDDLYEVPLSVNDMITFSGKSFTLTYNASVLELIDLSAFTKTKETSAGVISGTGITVTNLSEGSIAMTVDKEIPGGKKWSGVINVVLFRIKAAGGPNINFVYN